MMSASCSSWAAPASGAQHQHAVLIFAGGDDLRPGPPAAREYPSYSRVRVDTEGVVQDDTGQAGRTVTRTGIGAAIGAVIGAVTGGGQGAAIGAAIGAGAGAGSVFIQGRSDLDLQSGTEFRIRASAPR